MSAREHFEQEAFVAVQVEATTALSDLHRRGLDVGSLELLRHGDGNRYESELRIFIYRDGQICDALETHVWREGQPAGTLEELSEWFRSQLATIDC